MMLRFGSRIQTQTLNNPTHQIVDAIQNNRWKLPQTIKMESQTKRPTCPNCSKPTRLCLCKRIRIPGVDNPVSVTILQHSLERKHALNSTRIARLGLKNLTVATVFDVDFVARFIIRDLYKSGVDRNGIEISDFDQRLENRENQKQGSDCIDGSKLGKENAADLMYDINVNYSEEKGIDMIDDRGGCRKRQKSFGSLKFVQNLDALTREDASTLDSEKAGDTCIDQIHSEGNVVRNSRLEPLISVVIQKQGVIRQLSHSLMLRSHEDNPNLDRILTSQAAMDYLAKGFVVTKLSEEHEEFELDVPPGSVLLFPTNESVTVNDLKATGFKLKNLIVLDGTWAKAKRMYLENPWLKFLPHLKLDLEATSLYRDVRRQPKAGCLSTIESIVYAMKAIGEYPEGLDNLLDVFESMVDDQRTCKDERLNKVSES